MATSRTAKKGRNPFLDEQRAHLQAERAAHETRLAQLEAELAQVDVEETIADDPDEGFGEGAAAFVERDRCQALESRERAGIGDVDAALARIDAGTYGSCELCGQPIAEERLRFLPTTTTCVPCKQGGLLRRTHRPLRRSA